MDIRDIDGERYLGDAHLVLQCHHYNALLCQTLLLAPGFDGRDLLFRVSVEEFHHILEEAVRQSGLTPPYDEKAFFALAEEVYRTFGLGVLDFSQIDENGGEVICLSSHMATACLKKWGKQPDPADDFGRAFTAAAWALAYGRNAADCRVEQVRCIACGDSECLFRLEVV